LLKTRDQSELVNIGRVSAAVGLKGEVRIVLHSADSDNLKEGKHLLLKLGNKKFEADCVKVRYQNDRPVIRIEGVEDRNAAEELRGMEIFIAADQLEELPEGEHYVRDIVGYSVIDRASDTTIGTLKDVIQNTSQNVLDIEGEDGRQILVPAVDAFLKNIDDENGITELELIPGFI